VTTDEINVFIDEGEEFSDSMIPETLQQKPRSASLKERIINAALDRQNLLVIVLLLMTTFSYVSFKKGKKKKKTNNIHIYIILDYVC